MSATVTSREGQTHMTPLSRRDIHVVVILGILVLCCLLPQQKEASWLKESSKTTHKITFSPGLSTHAFGHRKICPSALSILSITNDDGQEDYSILEDAYNAAEAFHNGPGLLKAVETYLNSHIDSTLKYYNTNFIPEGKDEPIPDNESITAKIKELLQQKDVHNRGGYDQKVLPGKWTGKKHDPLDPYKRKVAVREQLDGERWVVGLGPIAEKVCKSVDIIRSMTDKKNSEDRFMCSFQDLQSRSSSNHHRPTEKCEVMSIGGNGQWGFEEAMVNTTNCVTHTFDCTVQNPRKPKHDGIHFYPSCISSKNEVIKQREYTTYKKLIKKAKMTGPPALLKMDVEGYEYDVLTQMMEEAVASGETDMLPSQISVELHYGTRMYDVAWMLRTLTAAEIGIFVGTMYRRGGYMLVHYEPIPTCLACVELLFVRVLCEQ